mmetsp:Transcript_16612/g.40916  ORF Transcript_16612/g.40916 Transcript_16612/m.40916 type:complete len:113 (-) Transcript_16612:222-560(-)|eukprot:CAMPEP_0114498162 /NCGR_PEP_ID=MMETSP0109-20121206/6726_1 /TAXON_ID=29199 /ORGANISM="Chlorarachnion reptans, Strain CCCM449" /LENGTH=112 /DNA_ID=CAMNT_0001675623 /DNA_START=423 /DNA_END=761 /DNA_ORIENTATION=+
MAFPCNQINRQEPDSNEVIKEFVSKKYGLPDGLELFSKVDVNGPNSHPVFKHLKSIFPGDIFGNFMGHFLIGRNGDVLHRFHAFTSYGSVEEEIVKALGMKNSTRNYEQKET